MIKFSREKILLLHKILAEATGGSVGVRDEALLDSALESAYAGFGGKELRVIDEASVRETGRIFIVYRQTMTGCAFHQSVMPKAPKNRQFWILIPELSILY